MKIVKVLIFTDQIEKWIEKLDKVLKINYTRGISWVRKDEAMLRNELFQIHLKRVINENCRGMDPSVIIVDKPIDYRIEWEVIKPLFGHGGSYIRGENYKLLNEPKFDLKIFEDILGGESSVEEKVFENLK